MALVLAVSAFVLYLRTLAPGILDGDSGEWQYMANILGVAHSTGYPLYLLLVKVMTLLPLGTPAWRVNLFSAICGALSVPSLYLLALRVSKSRAGALIAASLFAAAPTLWVSAVEAEVYALNTLLIALTLLFAVRWYQERRASDLYLMAFAFGLALDNHRVSLFVAPGLLLLVWFQRRWLNRRRLLLAALLVSAPLLLYGYVPLRASQLLQQQSAENWQLYPRAEAILDGKITAFYNPTLYGFLNLVTAFDNRTKLGFQDTGQDALRTRLSNAVSLLSQQFNPLALLLALAGIVLLFKRDPRLTLILIAGALGISAISTALHAQSTRFYFSGAYLTLALFLAVGVGALLARFQNRPRVRAGLLLLLALMPPVALWLNFPQADESSYTAYDAWARQIMADNLAPHSVVIAPWEIVTGLRYLQFVEGQRPDLLFVHESPVRPQYEKILASAHALKRPFYYVEFTPEDQNAPGPRTVQAVGMPLLTKPQPKYTLNAQLTDSVRVLGYDLSPDPALPGKFMRVALYYEVVAHTNTESTAELDLNDIRGEPHGYWERMPVSQYYPTYFWQPHDYYRDVWDIPLPTGAAQGLYNFQLTWYSFEPSTNATNYNDAHTLNFGPVRVGDFDAGAIALAQRAEFSNGMMLLGYNVEGAVKPGQKLAVSLFWSAVHPVKGAYTIFVHLEDANGVMRAQSDRPPWAGMFPTDRWAVGETVRDNYILTLPNDLAPGEYKLRVGLYQVPSQRAPLVAGGDVVSLNTNVRVGER